METGEFVTFGILVVIVVVIAVVARRAQVVHPPPGTRAAGAKDEQSSDQGYAAKGEPGRTEGGNTSTTTPSGNEHRQKR